MKATDIPAKFAIPFGASAGANYIRAIPQASQISSSQGQASLTDGFPPNTFVNPTAGGEPPDGRDLNGILNETTAMVRWLSAGAPLIYDSTFSSEIGGYPAGAVVASATSVMIMYLSTVDNNTTNPDGSSSAGWVNLTAGRMLGRKEFGSSGTYTPTPGTLAVDVLLIGGGASGGASAATGANQVSAGPGGGAGGWARKRFLLSSSGSVSITVGAGGAVTAMGGAGNAGGTTSYGNVFSATGGQAVAAGGAQAINGVPYGAGPGGLGQNGDTVGVGGLGTYAFYTNPATSGKGGASLFGEGGGYQTGSANGAQAVTVGAGGGGGVQSSPSSPASSGGSGAGGICIIDEYS